MGWVKWLIAGLALFEAGWMVFDGTRALIFGDYVTPGSGPHAGQLGPWTHLVAAVGLEPRSAIMKTIFVATGAAGLAVVACFTLEMRWAWWAMLIFAAGTLWYLVVGTVVSGVIIALLFLPSVRTAFP